LHGRPARWDFPRWQPATWVYYFDCHIVYLLVVNKFLSLSLCAVAGLLDEAPAINDVQVVHSSTSRVILSRVAVVVGVVLVVGVLIAVRLFVHVQSKIDFALLCIPTNSSDTDLLSARYTSTLYSNVTLPPCNMTSTVHLPASTWAAYVHNWAIIY